jgi:hypothetical protein
MKETSSRHWWKVKYINSRRGSADSRGCAILLMEKEISQ